MVEKEVAIVLNLVTEEGEKISELPLTESELTTLLEYAVNGILEEEIKRIKKGKKEGS